MKQKELRRRDGKGGHKSYNEKIITNYFLDIAINKKPSTEYSWPINQYFL